MRAVEDYLEAALLQLKKQDRLRTALVSEAEPDGRLRRGGHSCLDFSSNDYLGLAHHPLLKQRAAEWADLYGAGSGASRLVTGTSSQHIRIEERIAAFKGTEAALLFASGWQANAAVLPALLKALPGAQVFTDRLIHASLHHGIAAAGARQIRYRHNDLEHLKSLLEARADEEAPRLIVTESIFSMDGDAVDVPALADLARKHRAFLYLDDAHATGVEGPGGAGLSALAKGGIGLVMGTFSKAMGCFGAYVAGSRLLCDYLYNVCSGFVFTTAPPPAMLGAIDAALDLVPDMEAERAHLRGLAEQLRLRLRRAGFNHGASSSQIVPIIVGQESEALALSRQLERNGILAAAIRPPTVPAGSSRLRLTLRASFGPAEIDQLMMALGVA